VLKKIANPKEPIRLALERQPICVLGLRMKMKLLVELDSLEQDLDEEEGKEEEGKASKYQP
jgi:hypothetical protein